MRPSASWPTALRGARGVSWLVVKSSPARKTAAPSRTIWGPPPIADDDPGPVGLEEETCGHELVDRRLGHESGCRRRRRDEDGAARRDRNGGAARVDLDDRRREVGVRDRGREREQGHDRRALHGRRRRPPRLGVERDPVALERPVEGAEGVARPAPCQVPTNSTRRTSSVPSLVTPALARSLDGGLATWPSRISTPLGTPEA